MAENRREIKTVFAIDGEQTYSQAVKNINQNQKDLNNSMKAAEIQYKATGNEAEYNESKIRILNQQIQNQNQKLAEAKNALQQANDKYGAGSEQVSKYEGDVIAAQLGLQKYEDQLRKANDALAEQQSGLPKAAKAIEDLDKKQEGLNREMKLAESQYALTGDKAQYQKDKVRILTDQVDSQNKKLDESKLALAEANRLYGEGDDRVDQYAKAVDEAQIELNGLQKELKDAGSEIESTGDKMQKAGQKMSSVGDAMSKGITVPIMGIAAASAAAWAEIDDALDGITTATGAVGEDMEGFEKSFRDVFSRLPVEADKVGAAVGELNTQFGLTGDALTEATDYAVKFAEINGSDVVTSVQGAKGAISALGLESDDLNRVLDAVTTAAQKTGMGVDQVFDLVQKGAPQINALGLSVEEAALFMGQMEQAGLDAGRTLGGLTRAQGAAAKEGQTLNEALADFSDLALSGASETDKLAEAAKLFGTKNGPAMLQAAQQGVLDFDALAEAAGGAGGAVDKTFEGILDPADQAKVALNNFKLAGSDLFTAIQEGGAPILDDLAESAQKVAEWFRNLSPDTQELIIKFGAVFAAAGPVVSVTGRMVDSFGKLSNGLGKAVDKMHAGAEGTSKLSTALGKGSAVLGVAGAAFIAVKAIETYIYSLYDVDPAIQDAIRSSESLRDSYAQQNEEAEANASLNKSLADELIGLSRQSKLTAEDQARMAQITGQLNQLIPDLNLEIDTQTGNLSMNSDALLETVDAHNKRLESMAAEAAQIELLVEKERLHNQEKKLLKEMNELEEKGWIRLNEATGKYEYTRKALFEGGLKGRAQAEELIVAYNDLSTEIDANAEVIEDATAKNNEHHYAQAEAAKTAAAEQKLANEEVALSEEELAAAREKAQERQERINTRRHEALVSAHEREKALREEQKALVESYYDQLANLEQKNLDDMAAFGEMEVKLEEMTADKMLALQKKRMEGMRDYNKNLTELSDKVPAHVMDQLREMGPKAASLIAEYNSMSAEQLQVYVDGWVDYTGMAHDRAIEQLKDTPAALAAIAAEAGTQVDRSLSKLPGFVQTRMSEAEKGAAEEAIKLADTLRTAGQDSSKAMDDGLSTMPGKARAQAIAARQQAAYEAALLKGETKKAAEDAGESYAQGMRSKKDRVAAEARSLRDTALGNSKLSLYNEGVNAMDSFAAGIKARAHVVATAASNAAAQVPKATRNTLQIHSPSRVMWKLAEQTEDGRIAGMKAKEAEVRKTAEELANAAVVAPEVLDLQMRSRIAGSMSGLLTGSQSPTAPTVNNSENVTINVSAGNINTADDARRIGRLAYEGYQLARAAKGG